MGRMLKKYKKNEFIREMQDRMTIYVDRYGKQPDTIFLPMPILDGWFQVGSRLSMMTIKFSDEFDVISLTEGFYSIYYDFKAGVLSTFGIGEAMEKIIILET